MLFTHLDIIECINAVNTVNKSFQKVVTGIINSKTCKEFILAAVKMENEADSSKSFNNDMSKMRTQIRRGCESLDLPIMTVKKVDKVWSFVEVAEKEKNAFDEAVKEFKKNPTVETASCLSRIAVSMIPNT